MAVEIDQEDTNPFDPNQTVKAAVAIQKWAAKQKPAAHNKKANLLDDQDEADDSSSNIGQPLWLAITAKKPFATSYSLKPVKVSTPHSLYQSRDTKICIITPDPPPSNPNFYKDVINHPSFPAELRIKIGQLVPFSSLSKKFKAYEARRQLQREHDIFMVDNRCVHLLPAALGRVFYKSASKRPIPVSLTGKENWGQKVKKSPLERLKGKSKEFPHVVGKPQDVAQDIQKALDSLVINFSPSPTTAVKVGFVGWPVEHIKDNVDLVLDKIVSKFCPAGWLSLKALYLRSDTSKSLPIWMTDQLWVDENDIIEDGETEQMLEAQKAQRKLAKKEKTKSRKGALSQPVVVQPEETLPATDKSAKKRKVDPEDDAQSQLKKDSKRRKPPTIDIIESPVMSGALAVEPEVAIGTKEKTSKRKSNKVPAQELQAEPVVEETVGPADTAEGKTSKKERNKRAKAAHSVEMAGQAEEAPPPSKVKRSKKSKDRAAQENEEIAGIVDPVKGKTSKRKSEKVSVQEVAGPLDPEPEKGKESRKKNKKQKLQDTAEMVKTVETSKEKSKKKSKKRGANDEVEAVDDQPAKFKAKDRSKPSKRVKVADEDESADKAASKATPEKLDASKSARVIDRNTYEKNRLNFDVEGWSWVQ